MKRKDDILTIVLADDDEDDRALITSALTELKSHKILTVKNGEELVKILKHEGILKGTHHLPDIIILDLEMPRMSGLEALRIIKSDDTLKNIPVFIFSSHFNIDDVQTFIQMGVNGYFEKSLDFEDWKKTLEEICFDVLAKE